MNGAAAAIPLNTKNVEKPDTMLLPIDLYAYVATTPLQSGSDTTILTFFLKNSPWVKQVEPWEKLSTAGSGSTNRMVVYKRDPSKLQLVIPQEYEEFPPVPKGLTADIACHARIGGVRCFYPMSVVYADGV
jgi:hypothetical protein